MNHYERLKVSPDAPIEVIRAAYRALAAKHHPDRHTQSESSHKDMVALNAAYEVLADAAARAAYDAELAEAAASTPAEPAGGASRLHNLWRSTMGFGSSDHTQPPSAPHDEHEESRVDVHWQPPLPASAINPWMDKKRLVPLVSVLGGLVLVVGVWWVRAAMLQMEAEQTLSQHYGGRLHPDSAGIVPGDLPAADRKPVAVTMTDEELLAPPPPVVARPSGGTASSNHLLDGSPLTLRPEVHLVDPLAPAHAAVPQP